MIKRATLFVIIIVVNYIKYLNVNMNIYSLLNLSVFQVVYGVDQELENEEILAQDYMNELNGELARCSNLEVIAEWNYASNITDENEKIKTELSAKNAEFYKVKNVFFFG